MKIPPAPNPQINLAAHSVRTSSAMTIRTQLRIIGVDMIRRQAFLPTLSTIAPKKSVPQIPPKLITEPIHEASEGVIGPLEKRGFVSDVRSRTAGDTHPQEPPKDMGRRFTGRVKGFN